MTRRHDSTSREVGLHEDGVTAGGGQLAANAFAAMAVAPADHDALGTDRDSAPRDRGPEPRVEPVTTSTLPSSRCAANGSLTLNEVRGTSGARQS